jgi:hypothetical protein
MDKKKKSTATAIASMKSPDRRTSWPPNVRIVENFLVIWLDGSIDEINNKD